MAVHRPVADAHRVGERMLGAFCRDGLLLRGATPTRADFDTVNVGDDS
jgi:hypothetical protein